jgi:glutathione S-transferase
MLKLYGFPVSHYYNMVKHTLLVKGLAFDEVLVMPGTGADYLDKSPLGKIPCIETEHGFLSESSVIFDYLEVAYPQVSLSPADHWGQAKMKELMKISELYIELQGRPWIAASMGIGEIEQAKLDEAALVLTKGFTAIAKLSQFKPYLLGEQMTQADIMLRYCLVVIKGSAGLPNLDVAGFVAVDLNQLIPELAAWEQLMGESAISQKIDAVVAQEMPKLMAMRQQKHT